MTTNDELLKLIALGDKATVRPWYALIFDTIVEISTAPKNAKAAERGEAIIKWSGFDDSDFSISKQKSTARYITAAANLAPDIARELIEAREALAKANEDADALDDEILTLMRYVEPGEDYYRMIKKHVAHRARIGGDK